VLREFEQHITKNQLFSRKNQILVAVSGGMDSMVLCDLLLKLNFTFSVAHVNFKLRGRASEKDEQFVASFCKSHQIPFFASHCFTKAQAKEAGISVQMAAREFRYAFFETLRQKHRFDIILTAHHLSDSIETYFINIIRGSGIEGLKGIQTTNGCIVRPLLVYSRNQIAEYAKKNDVQYREDSSNSDDKYMRNYLRLHIIPKFINMNPAFEEGLKKQLASLQQYNTILKYYLQKEIKKIVKQENNITIINTEKLIKSDAPELLLFEILKPFRFNSKQISKIFESAKGISGKEFRTAKYVLIKERGAFLIKEKTEPKKNETILIHEKDTVINFPLTLIIKAVKKMTIPAKAHEIYTDKAKLIFPLIIRGWKKGDKIKPFGMKGSKKVSDLFTEFKLTQNDKNNLRILENGNKEIIWVINLKFDDRYKVTSETKNIIKIEVIEP
jgi:tRNA(Ile)-lysidine synthase